MPKRLHECKYDRNEMTKSNITSLKDHITLFALSINIRSQCVSLAFH
jgi:hypothetical protein